MSNDQGYKSVIKEYDYYNNNLDDFEIIDEIPSTYKNKTQIEKDNNNINTQNNNLRSINSDQKKELQQFVTDLFRIIFNSRNKLSEFSSKSRQNLNIGINDYKNTFSYYLEDLTAYDDLKDFADNKNDNKKQKYIIDFYLYKKYNNENTDHKKRKATRVPKLLVERWKIKYKENFAFKDFNKDCLNKNNLDDYIKTKFKLIEKAVILYSHILPLYNIIKDKSNYIEFKFYPNSKGKKKFIENNMTKKIKIIKEDFFDFKLSIIYLDFKLDDINILKKKTLNGFEIIQGKKSRMRLLSPNFNKKSTSRLFFKENKDDKNENNNKNVINELIIDNYFNDINGNIENNNISRNRRFSVKERKNNDIENKDSLDDSSFEEDLQLAVSKAMGDKKNDNVHINNNNNMIKIQKENINIINKEVNNNTKFSAKESETFEKKAKEKKDEIDNLSNFESKNINITKIVREYKNIKRMIEMMPNYGDIDFFKLNNFIANS